MKNALILADQKKKFLFEICPQMFPPFLTAVEINLWRLFYDEQAELMERASGNG